MITKIAVIGAGKLGSALGYVLQDSPVAVEFWDVDAVKMPKPMGLSEVVGGAQVVLLCLPSWVKREAAKEVVPYLDSKAVGVFTLAKGVEEQTNMFMVEVLRDVLGAEQVVGVISGPMLADELTGGKMGAGLVACDDMKLADAFVEVFAGTNLLLETSDDVLGVSLGGVLKNVYAMGLGMIEGLSAGDDMRGWFVTRAVGEMAQIMEALGGKAETAYSVAGLADLVATGFSPHSRNYRVGRELAESGNCQTVSEGHQSFPQLLERLGDEAQQWPLLMAVKRVCVDCEPAGEVFKDLAIS